MVVERSGSTAQFVMIVIASDATKADLSETRTPGTVSASGYWSVPAASTTAARQIAAGFDSTPVTAFFLLINVLVGAFPRSARSLTVGGAGCWSE